MTIASLCRRNPDRAEPGESIKTAAQRMGARAVGTLVVCEDDKPVGILTDRDVAIRVAGAGLDPLTTRVSEVMSRALVTVRSQTPIEDALKSMRDANVRRLIVVDSTGDLQAIVSLDDIMRHLAEELSAVEEVLEESSPESVA